MDKKYLALFLFMSLLVRTIGQIPNSDFSQWNNTAGYKVPEGWDNLNSMTALMSVYTCTPGTLSITSNIYYLELTSKTLPNSTVVPGISVSGKMTKSLLTHSYVPVSGFPYTQRPMSLTGTIQYMAYGSDTGYIAVCLTRWDTIHQQRDTVAYLYRQLLSMQMDWLPFAFDLTYLSTQAPDSAIIILSSSGYKPVDASYLYINKIGFDNNPAGVAGIAADSHFSLFPNPAINILHISLLDSPPPTVTIYDSYGRRLRDITLSLENASIDVSALDSGIYFLRSDCPAHTPTCRFLIAR